MNITLNRSDRRPTPPPPGGYRISSLSDPTPNFFSPAAGLQTPFLTSLPLFRPRLASKHFCGSLLHRISLPIKAQLVSEPSAHLADGSQPICNYAPFLNPCTGIDFDEASALQFTIECRAHGVFERIRTPEVGIKSNTMDAQRIGAELESAMTLTLGLAAGGKIFSVLGPVLQ